MPRKYALKQYADFYKSSHFQEFLNNLDSNFPRGNSKAKKIATNQFIAETRDFLSLDLTKNDINYQMGKFRKKRELENLRALLLTKGLNEEEVTEALSAISQRDEEEEEEEEGKYENSLIKAFFRFSFYIFNSSKRKFTPNPSW